MFGGKGHSVNFYQTGDELFHVMCQLEREMARQDWLVHPASPELIFSESPEELWKSILRQKGFKGMLAAEGPEDISWN